MFTQMASVFHFGLLLLISGQLLLTATAAPDPEGVEPKCASGWVEVEKRCLKLSQVPEAWPDADFLCMLDNAHLVSFRNPKDAALVRLMVSKVDKTITSVWIGAVIVPETGKWMWTDSTPVPKDFLALLDDQNEGSCMVMKMSGKEKSIFQKSKCLESLPYICSKDM
ncbi:snaclec coagulation factor IX/factor X-binding protein subunit B-like isoform X1 [Larimichthys crocea]|uniref:snaclec coagulation factor IX/factor X-binding protein subunit B-like isoform X1 n=2 Tax=Larimichthys crocea TaxID=215358 RepID=UPI0009013A2C|nr:snaclec coagulation factor IX/factor X-binding protein subunit B-like isoform X1 [Larimichthys crocea]